MKVSGVDPLVRHAEEGGNIPALSDRMERKNGRWEQNRGRKNVLTSHRFDIILMEIDAAWCAANDGSSLHGEMPLISYL
mgnify:CR=1 FL=1